MVSASRRRQSRRAASRNSRSATADGDAGRRRAAVERAQGGVDDVLRLGRAGAAGGCPRSDDVGLRQALRILRVERAARLEPGAGEQPRHLQAMAGDAGGQARACLRGPEVHGDHLDVDAVLHSELLGQGLEPIAATGHQDQARAAGGELGSEHHADARARAGDRRGLRAVVDGCHGCFLSSGSSTVSQPGTRYQIEPWTQGGTAGPRVWCVTSPSGAPSLWSRTRQAVHAQVVDTALDLFTAQGFEATTIEQVVAAAGISRTSFFRYFGSKEDVVLGDVEQSGRMFSDALRDRPSQEGPWEALRAAALALPGAGLTPERALAVAKLISASPSLRARRIEKQLRWQDSLVPVMQERLRQRPEASDLAARAIVATALSCLHMATEVWAERDGQGTLGELYDQAVAAVRR